MIHLTLAFVAILVFELGAAAHARQPQFIPAITAPGFTTARAAHDTWVPVNSDIRISNHSRQTCSAAHLIG